jgi:Kinesin motor domain
MRRTIGETHANKRSSRSHAIFTIRVGVRRPVVSAATLAAARLGASSESAAALAAASSEWQLATMQLVDLAGGSACRLGGTDESVFLGGELRSEAISL